MKKKGKNSNYNPYWEGKTCKNPWNKKCKHKDIVVYIDYKKERKPICRSCWRKIANSKYEWG